MDGIQQPSIHPRIFPWSPDKSLDPVMATLTRVTHRTLVSVTGGCATANMTYESGREIIELFTTAFKNFAAVMLIGGSRMIRSDDPEQILFGITEVAPAIRVNCPESFVLGIIPRLQEIVFYQAASMLKIVHIIGEKDTPDHISIVHPNQDFAIGVVKSLQPQRSRWHDEVEFRRYLTENLRAYGGWNSLLVAYNGGEVTESEVLETAERGWPVLLIEGSGRVTDKLARDVEFLRAYSNVHTCEHSAVSLRRALIELDALPSGII